jgi:hypothetical protein
MKTVSILKHIYILLLSSIIDLGTLISANPSKKPFLKPNFKTHFPYITIILFPFLMASGLTEINDYEG